MFTTIVVGIDGSDTSMTAIRTACAIAKTNDATLILVHAPHPETVAFAMGAVAGYHMVTTMPSIEEVADAAEKTLEKGRQAAVEAGYPATKSVVRRGDPGNDHKNDQHEADFKQGESLAEHFVVVAIHDR